MLWSRRSFVAAVAALLSPLATSFAVAAEGKTKVACVGDSITFGAGVEDRAKNNYPAVLGRLLGEKYEVKNFGNSGSTLLRNGDKPYHKQKDYTAAIDFKPDIVVIKLGTNDSKPQNWDKHKADFAADYKTLIGAFRQANPNVKVYAALPVPVYPPGAFKIRDEVVKEIIPVIKQVAADEKAEVIDLYAALSDKPKLFPDKVHPNAAGAELIAKAVHAPIAGK